MKIDVLFGVQNLTPQDVQGRVVAMIDVLRASSTIAVALANGARAIIPLGNSPVEHSRGVVEGKTVLLTTTNGTRALLAVQGARDVVVASYVNLTAVCAMLRAALRGGSDVTIVCAGQDRQFALEDAACAGRYVYQIAKRLPAVESNDAALAASLIDRKYGDNLMRLFQTAAHGRALAAAGFEEDLTACAAVDSYPVIPIYQDRHITKLGPERER